jgi:hypothetical protein
MQVIPLNPVPSQCVTCLLNGQYTQLNVYQKFFGLFMDIYVNNALIIGGVLCENLNAIVRSLYLGFEGDFTWLDNQGATDPAYTGLGSRYSLIYLEPSDLADANQ